MKLKIMTFLTLMAAGRAMTLAFLPDVGSTDLGAPPRAWLMPLVGDAVIGCSALVVAYLIVQRTGLWVWTTVIAWNVVAIWDALSAYLVHTTTPWPEFFMIRMFGPAMFFAAVLMHLAIIVLACQTEVRDRFLTKDITARTA